MIFFPIIAWYYDDNDFYHTDIGLYGMFLSACGQTASSRKNEQDKKAVCAMMSVIILSTLL